MAKDSDKPSVVGVPGKGDTPAAGKPAGGSSPADQVVSQAEAAIRKRKPYTKRGSADMAATEAENARITAELEKVFAPEHWEALVRAPADLRLAQTGFEHWKMSDNEVKTLASSASNTARYFMRTDPKWVVLTLFLFNIGTIYGGRVLMDYNLRKKEAELKAGKREPTEAHRPGTH